jgi:hypothetical protein
MAVTTQFGIPDQNGAHATLMPKLQYRFRVSFSGLGDDLATDTTTQNVISVGRPSITHEEVIIDSYSSKTYLAGKHTWEPITLVMRDDLNSNVIKAIGNQLKEQLNHETQGAKASDNEHAGNVYKFTMKIETLDGTAEAKPYDTWTLAGCYLSNVQYGDLNYGTSELVQVTTTIRYDNASNQLHVGNVETDTLGN